MRPWAQRGYAVLAFSARGFGESCGSAGSRLADPIGYALVRVRLADAARRTGRRRSWRGGSIGPPRAGARSSNCIPSRGTFAAGPVVRLELVGRDAHYARASNGTFEVGVSALELRLPVRERRGAQVRRPLAPVPGR
jgi:hypothetical protein